MRDAQHANSFDSNIVSREYANTMGCGNSNYRQSARLPEQLNGIIDPAPAPLIINDNSDDIISPSSSLAELNTELDWVRTQLYPKCDVKAVTNNINRRNVSTNSLNIPNQMLPNWKPKY